MSPAAWALVLAGCTGGDGLPEPQPPPPRVAWWYEDADLSPLLESMERLGEERVTLHVALHPDQVDWVELESLLLVADEHEVPVGLWPLLRVEDGYFPNVRNAELFATWWGEIAAEVEGLPVDALVVDLEPDLDVLLQLQSTTDLGALTELLIERHDPEVFAQGTAVLAGVAEEASAAGLRVSASTLFLVLDDPLDGDDDVQRVFDVPVQAVDWDEVSFQVYRPSFDDFLGLTGEAGITSHVVYDYGRTAVEHWGEAAALDLGLVGHDRYSPQALSEDVAAALAAGLELDDLHVYSVQTALRQDDPWVWLDAVRGVEPERPDDDAMALLVRALVQQVDEGAALPE